MSIYKKGQKVKLRSEKTAIVQTEAEMLPEGKSKIEYYWVLLEENKQKLHIKGIDILGAIDPVNYSNKIMEVAKKKLTTAVWYTWGLDEYQQQWVDAAKQRELLEHAVKIPKAFDNLVGPGLYVAQQMMSSSVYAKEGATVLIVELKKVPTINSKDKPQMAALAEGVPSVKYEDLVDEKRHSKPEECARYLHIYGNYACLTAHEGVTVYTDLSKLPLDELLKQGKKLATEAKAPLLAQAEKYLKEDAFVKLKNVLK